MESGGEHSQDSDAHSPRRVTVPVLVKDGKPCNGATSGGAGDGMVEQIDSGNHHDVTDDANRSQLAAYPNGHVKTENTAGSEHTLCTGGTLVEPTGPSHYVSTSSHQDLMSVNIASLNPETVPPLTYHTLQGQHHSLGANNPVVNNSLIYGIYR